MIMESNASLFTIIREVKIRQAYNSKDGKSANQNKDRNEILHKIPFEKYKSSDDSNPVSRVSLSSELVV